jgi:hypothetical protein
MTSADPLSTERAAVEAVPWIVSLRDVQNRLATVVKPLGSEAIRGQSFHSWTIAEVLSHLGSQADVFDGVLTSGLGDWCSVHGFVSKRRFDGIGGSRTSSERDRVPARILPSSL